MSWLWQPLPAASQPSSVGQFAGTAAVTFTGAATFGVTAAVAGAATVTFTPTATIENATPVVDTDIRRGNRAALKRVRAWYQARLQEARDEAEAAKQVTIAKAARARAAKFSEGLAELERADAAVAARIEALEAELARIAEANAKAQAIAQARAAYETAQAELQALLDAHFWRLVEEDELMLLAA